MQSTRDAAHQIKVLPSISVIPMWCRGLPNPQLSSSTVPDKVLSSLKWPLLTTSSHVMSKVTFLWQLAGATAEALYTAGGGGGEECRLCLLYRRLASSKGPMKPEFQSSQWHKHAPLKSLQRTYGQFLNLAPAHLIPLTSGHVKGGVIAVISFISIDNTLVTQTRLRLTGVLQKNFIGVHVYGHTCLRVLLSVMLCAHTHLSVFTCGCVCMHVWCSLSVCVCMCVHACILLPDHCCYCCWLLCFFLLPLPLCVYVCKHERKEIPFLLLFFPILQNVILNCTGSKGVGVGGWMTCIVL